MFRIGQKEIDAVAKAIQTKSLFKVNDRLKITETAEAEMREMFQTKHAMLMTSGHAALTSALIGMGIGPGDEVIVPAYTYISSAMAVVAAGAIPIIAEVDETLTISPDDILKKLSKHTKAIIPVHIQGFPCNMDAIRKIAKEHALFVLEDACQADGGAYKGKRLGTLGDAGALSFNYFKIITAGEGGALLTDDKDIFERALIYHDSSAVAYFGDQLKDFSTDLFCGNEYRTNEISSAILRAQLTQLDDILQDLRKNKKYVMDALADVCSFIPSNDILGDCGTTIAFSFDSAEKADRFSKANGIHGVVPINTDKHVYRNWTPILEKKGAFHPLMDPFKMEANRDIVPNYTKDMCPKTLDLLSKAVYVSVDPDWSVTEMDALIRNAKKALESLK
ncbi:MAG: aminotransferase class I/II-fold pyridoxal phosphate-dependent enzyme [Clostridia bacterium]|nr:aminotransferase class I/II-fold pyridoxal phosphate-dependent enzyme [Clostridia bacterium]